METEWKLKRKSGAFSEIAAKFHVGKRIASLICNRDIEGDENIRLYLEGNLNDLYDGILMKDMEKACVIIKEKLDDNKRIRIIGDYDADGINAAYILVKGLSELGGCVDYAIPNRVTDGYGVNRGLVEKAYKEGVDTIITCDNGIAAKEALDYGKELGLTIIVTDHHEVPFEIPDVDAIVNPKQEDCTYPFKGLCGAAIAYKLIETLFNFMGKDVDDIDDLLENVAIATVTDIMELKGENRIFVKEGIARLKRTKNYGLLGIYEAAGIKKENLGTYHLGFVIGPMLNATGRLEDASLALDLLFAEGEEDAGYLAEKIRGLNEQRKGLTEEALKTAEAIIEEKRAYEDDIILVYLPGCHESLAGIVAGKVKDKYNRPALVFTDGKEGLKGSGRSIEAYDLYKGISACKDLLLKFGGHKQAAGLSLKKENLTLLRNRMNKESELKAEDFVKKIVIDMELPFSEINKEFIEELSLLEPFGNGNKKPVFALRGTSVSSAKVVGANKGIRCVFVDRDNHSIPGIYWENNDIKKTISAIKDNRVDILFYPGINCYNGSKTIQLEVKDYRIRKV